MKRRRTLEFVPKVLSASYVEIAVNLADDCDCRLEAINHWKTRRITLITLFTWCVAVSGCANLLHAQASDSQASDSQTSDNQENAVEVDSETPFAQSVESAESVSRMGLPAKELDWKSLTVDARMVRIAELLRTELSESEVELFLSELNSLWSTKQPQRVQLSQWIELCQSRIPRTQVIAKELQLEIDQLRIPDRHEAADWLRDHVLLSRGCELARQQKYDLAQVALHSLKGGDVLFPSELLFYRGLVNYKLMDFEAARQDLELLLKHPSAIDRRSVSLSELMLADLPESDDPSLRQIARVMDDALRRQGLSQAGQRVLNGEQKVIDLLDQLIKQKQEQQQQQQQQQQQSQAQSKSAKPMEKGMRAPLLGKGEVDPKRMSAKEWGDLPPEKQAEVIAEMTRQMPPHYKKVIEEYFRRLADDQGK